MSFWLSQILYEEMAAEASKWSPLETGGALVGYVADSGDVVVTASIQAGPEARRTRWSFRPDAGFQNQEIAKHYEASGRLDGYLGDWHTHPGGSSRMSWRDRRTLQAIAEYPHARIINPVMVILYGADWKLAPWQFSHRTLLAHAPCTRMLPRLF